MTVCRSTSTFEHFRLRIDLAHALLPMWLIATIATTTVTDLSVAKSIFDPVRYRLFLYVLVLVLSWSYSRPWFGVTTHRRHDTTRHDTCTQPCKWSRYTSRSTKSLHPPFDTPAVRTCVAGFWSNWRASIEDAIEFTCTACVVCPFSFRIMKNEESLRWCDEGGIWHWSWMRSVSLSWFVLEISYPSYSSPKKKNCFDFFLSFFFSGTRIPDIFHPAFLSFFHIPS